MAKNTNVIPYTEIVERTAQMARIQDDGLSRVRAAAQDEYRDIRNKEDWTFLLATSAIAATAPYTTGVATVNTQATTVTFASGTVLDATFTNRKIKFNTNSNVYDLTYTSPTAATISPPLSGDTNVSSDAFTIFQDTYALPLDFSRFPRNAAVLLQQGGRNTPIKESKSYESWVVDYNPSPSAPSKCRLVEFGTSGLRHVQLNPPPNKAYLLPYSYIRDLPSMRETTAGFVDMNSSGTAVVGSAGTTRFTEVSSENAYFRINAFGKQDDSEWYRLVAVAHNSAATLQVSFGLSGATTAGYTISTAPLMPPLMHPALIYGALMRVLSDQNDPQFAWASSMKSAVLNDAKRLYKTRDYSQEVEGVWEEFLYRR